MTSKLFSPFTIKNTTFKNRIVMAPMCMYSSHHHDGIVQDWHFVHYTSRAVGQVGLIIQEATAVTAQGRISQEDLGIWSDDHLEGLRKLTASIKAHGCKAGIQLAHAGRKAEVDSPIIAPSAIPFNNDMKQPEEMTIEQINETITAFKEGAGRARTAGYDVIEIHAAHGYLINEFLSPLTNQRNDTYGGSAENRYRFLREVIEAVKSVCSGPLFVRISANEYTEGGLDIADYVKICEWMKAQGVDLIDVSSGGVVPAKINTFPGYQVRYSEKIKADVDIPTGAVGLITTGIQAEEILQNERADVVLLGRELLRDPYWPRTAAEQLDVSIDSPAQYGRAWQS